MSLLPDFPSIELDDFGGAWLLSDPSMVPLRGALLAKNVEYSSGEVASRHGFAVPAGSIFPASISLGAMYVWYAPFSSMTGFASSTDSALAYLDTAAPAVEVYLLSGGHLFSVGYSVGATSAAATLVGVGLRLYFVTSTTTQAGVTLGVLAPLSDGTSSRAIMFASPMTYVPSAPTEPSAGLITAGVHRLAYVVEDHSGFMSRLSPDAGTLAPPDLTTFSPLTFTATGAKNASWTLNPTQWPQGSAYVSVAMTTTTNLNQYYIVPGTRTAVPSDFSASSKTIAFSISDADLASRGTDATPNLYWLTRRPGTEALPFTVRHIALFGERMAYLASAADLSGNPIDALYISERNSYQSITADQHVKQLPGQRSMTTMFRMGTTNYICGPHEIYSLSDNNDVPVTWPTPRLVDGRCGTLAVRGVEVSPSGDFAWVADQGGLYVFTGGSITALAVSYEQTPDWNRINWSKAYCVQIKDDAANKRVYVMVPLDAATTPSHIMMWDYTDGTTYDKVRYSLNNLTSYSLGAMELVRNDLAAAVAGTKKKVELWLGSSTTAVILRQLSDFDTNPYRDNGVAITSTYRTAPLPGRAAARGLINQHHGFKLRITGAGTMTPKMYDIDAAKSFTCTALTLATAPDVDALFLGDLLGELGFAEFSTSTLDTYWSIAYLCWYYSPWLIQR